MFKIFWAMVVLCAYAFAGCDSDVIQKTLKKLQKELPMKIDAYTTAYNITCKNSYLIYDFKVTDTEDIKFNELTKEQKDTVLNAMGSQIKNMCPNLKGGFAGQISGIQYNYFLENKKPFGEVKLDVSECK